MLQQEICSLQQKCEDLNAAEESLNAVNNSLCNAVESMKSELAKNNEKFKTVSEQLDVDKNDDTPSPSKTRSELELVSEVMTWRKLSQERHDKIESLASEVVSLCEELDNWQKTSKGK
eukprot:2790437-Ditylum_brightwellii.AAC.1